MLWQYTRLCIWLQAPSFRADIGPYHTCQSNTVLPCMASNTVFPYVTSNDDIEQGIFLGSMQWFPMATGDSGMALLCILDLSAVSSMVYSVYNSTCGFDSPREVPLRPVRPWGPARSY